MLTGVSITWPQATNGNLNSIKFDGNTIYNTSTGGGSLTIPPPPLQGTRPSGRSPRVQHDDLQFTFQNNVNTNAANYTGSATFNPFGSRYDPAIKSSARLNNEGPAKAGPFVFLR